MLCNIADAQQPPAVTLRTVVQFVLCVMLLIDGRVNVPLAPVQFER